MRTRLMAGILAAVLAAMWPSDSASALQGAPSAAPRESRISVGKASLYSREIGRGQPVIVLHGGPDFDHRYFLPDLGLRGEMHGIRADLRGEMQGMRDDLRGEMQGMGDELRAEMRALHDAALRYLRVLHEDLVEGIRTIAEGRPWPSFRVGKALRSIPP